MLFRSGALYINIEEFAFNITFRYYNTFKTQQEVNYCIYFLISVLKGKIIEIHVYYSNEREFIDCLYAPPAPVWRK